MGDTRWFETAEEAVKYYDAHSVIIYNNAMQSVDRLGYCDRLRGLIKKEIQDWVCLEKSLQIMHAYIQGEIYKGNKQVLSYHLHSAILFTLAESYKRGEKTREECEKMFRQVSPYLEYPEWWRFDLFCKYSDWEDEYERDSQR